jgi:hypothetical protein
MSPPQDTRRSQRKPQRQFRNFGKRLRVVTCVLPAQASKAPKWLWFAIIDVERFTTDIRYNIVRPTKKIRRMENGNMAVFSARH